MGEEGEEEEEKLLLEEWEEIATQRMKQERASYRHELSPSPEPTNSRSCASVPRMSSTWRAWRAA